METNIKAPELKKPTPAIPGGLKGKSSLQLFLVDALRDIYWAEQELVKALPNMIAGATSGDLAGAIAAHLDQTVEHVKRLEEVFSILGLKAEAKPCFAMQGLIKEGESILEETDEGSATRDAAIIMAAQKVEHYEIATYGSLVEYAKTLGYNDLRGILQLTLDEECMTDHGLTIIAQNKINWEADTEDVNESGKL
jgi:ferritin-like metal-binding protein YciE